LRYALTCFLPPITQGNNFVLSPTAINNNPPASSSSFFDTEEGVDGSDLIKWRRVEKWDRTNFERDGFDLFWFSRLFISFRGYEGLLERWEDMLPHYMRRREGRGIWRWSNERGERRLTLSQLA